MNQTRLKKIDQEAERLYEAYRDQMDLLDKSPLAKVRETQGAGGITPYDYWCLGKMLESWETFTELVEDVGNTNLLGKIPTIAHDVITAVQGAAIMPVIASTQPIEDERGTVYFKTVRAASTRGSVTDGDVLTDPRSNVTTPDGYSSSQIDGEVIVASTAGATTNYTGNLAVSPVRAETLKLTTSISGVEGLDVGPEASDTDVGRIFGKGISGTINYSTGAFDIDFEADPGGGESVTVEYQQNFELDTDIQKIDTFFDSKTIHARIYALKAQLGMFQSFGLSKRFGMNGEEAMARDLVSEINKEIGGDMIRKLRANSVGSTTFSLTLPSGVSRFEHELAWKKSKADAEAVLVGNAGRGTINTLIVGREHAGLIETLPGFNKMFDGNSLGVHVYGTIDGMTVVRVTEDALLGAKQGIALWKGTSPFESACVWSPFMPLTVTGVLPEAPNPLVSMRAAAVWAGVDTLVPQYATKFDIAT